MSKSEVNQEYKNIVLLKSNGGPETGKWQRDLLPLMKRMIVFLAIFFFVASFFQLLYLQWSVQKSPPLNQDRLDTLFNNSNLATFQEKIEIAKFKTSYALEENTINNRYHQANVLLMSSLWIRYLGFVTGMILALVGAVFILGKLQESATEAGAQLPGGSMAFKSTSPGIILTILGASLMIVTIVMQHQLNVRDGSVYFNKSTQAPLGLDAAKPKADF